MGNNEHSIARVLASTTGWHLFMVLMVPRDNDSDGSSAGDVGDEPTVPADNPIVELSKQATDFSVELI